SPLMSHSCFGGGPRRTPALSCSRGGPGRKMSTQRINKKEAKGNRNDDGKVGSKQLTLAEATPGKSMADANAESEMLAELKKLENTMEELKQRTEGLDKRLTEVENRVSAKEDSHIQHEKVLSYLLHREASLASKCDDMENRLRRNNIRLYGIPEGSEKDDMVKFVCHFFKTALEIREEIDINVERAHRALGPKPRSTTAPPRSIIVRFLDFQVKQAVLQQAWKQRQVEFQGHKVYFDQDYSSDLQKKRKKVREVIKKLKEKNIRAQSPYPAQLRIFTQSGARLFPSLLEAKSTLKELGINMEMEDRDVLEMELARDGWKTHYNDRRQNRLQLSTADIRALISGGHKDPESVGHE
uniref:L1 transposable element RRM domain-containing protein n=1 Tax=Oryzias latipes TaxID=8090 RepID=H2MAH2_ORYLA